jgi:N-acetyl-anhydromuramyl-L-alanine amidase AmpD
MRLQSTAPGARGGVVRALQRALSTLGYDLGPWGADGVYGAATADAVRAFQRAVGLTIDGIAGPKTIAALQRQLDRRGRGSTSPRPPQPTLPESFVDRRGRHGPPPLYSASRSPRSWLGDHGRVIQGVTLHQTGIFIAEVPERWDTLNAHIAVLRDGRVILTNALSDFIWHAQGLSASTIGIEFNGSFPGVVGRSNTVWRHGGGPHALTAAQLEAADRLFVWLRATFAANGGRWTRVHAHRQSSASRRADPGSEIWQKVGLRWLELLGDGATDGGTGFCTGSGRPVPEAWNPAYQGNRY